MMRESQNGEMGLYSGVGDNPISATPQRKRTQIDPDGAGAFYTAADMEEVLAKIADASKALILISMAKGIDESVAAAVHGLAETIAGATNNACVMAEDIARKTWGYCHATGAGPDFSLDAQNSSRIEPLRP